MGQAQLNRTKRFLTLALLTREKKIAPCVQKARNLGAGAGQHRGPRQRLEDGVLRAYGGVWSLEACLAAVDKRKHAAADDVED